MSNKISDFRSWIEKAENDFLCIENNLAADRIPIDIICFHAQQAAEKYLKAYLVLKGEIPNRTHDLDKLLQECRKYDTTVADISEDCNFLTFFAIESRYPMDEEVEPEDMKLAIKASERIRDAIKRRLQR